MKTPIRKLDSLTHNDTAATKLINDNFEALQQGIEDSLSRTGKTPNFMDAVLDMNMNRIINIADPVDDYDLANKHYVDEQVALERNRAIAAEAIINGRIDGEINRATAAEGALRLRIDNIDNTLSGFGDIVTHDADEFATAEQGAKADTALQPGDLPTVGNGTISLIQGGVLKGTFTTNQGGDTSIELDAGGGGDERVGLRFNFMVTFPENSDQIEVDVSDIMPDGKYYPIVFVSDNLNSKDLNRQVAYDCENKTVKLKRNPDIIREESFATQYVMLPVNTQTNLINGQSNGQFIPSNKNLYYTKTEVNTIASGKQDNLTTAQLNAVNSGITSAKVTQYDGYATSIDSQNGTVSNCIIKIPQNLKLEISGMTFTAKTGSVLTRTGSTYATETIMQDLTYTFQDSLGNGRFVIFGNATGLGTPRKIDNVYSGNSSQYPTTGLTSTTIYFNTDDKLIYRPNNDFSAWNTWGVDYPLCVVDVANGVLSFAKDSKGRDLIFNGCGFIGHHIFTYPQTRYLSGNGYEDGKLASYDNTLNSLVISEMSTTTHTGYDNVIVVRGNNNTVAGSSFWRTVKSYDELLPQSARLQFVEDDNISYAYASGSYSAQSRIYLCTYEYDGTTVTKFDIRQPYEGARNLLTDDIEEEIGDIETALTTIIGA